MEKVRERTGIYHEHQEGALCAQHALNNLLQNEVFLADTLADIARGLDAEEKSVLTHGSFQSENMDDTGFFSIQVLQRALTMFDIELVPFASQEPIAEQARSNPEKIQAYICNLGLHWFTIRRFGSHYFDLNSFYYAPKLIPGEILQIFLNLILENGYSVFIVHGKLDICVADGQLTANPITPEEYEILTKDLPKLIMDDKVLGNSKDSGERGNLALRLPKDLYDEFQKDPTNPRIREMISAKLPKGVRLAEIPEHASCSDPHHHPHPRRQLVLAFMPKRITDGQRMEACDCPDCLESHSILPEHFSEQMIDDTDIDRLNELPRRSQRITEHVTQRIITTSDPDNPDAPPQQHVLTTRRVVVTGSSSRNDTLTNKRDIQRMSKPSFGLETDDRLLRQVMVESLLGKSGMTEDMINPFFEDQSEQSYQQSLDKAIAASLHSNHSAIEPSGDTPELIPMTTLNSDPIIIKIPSPLANTYSPPPSPSTNGYSPPPINTSSPPATITNSSPLMNTCSSVSITQNLPPPTVTSSPPPTTTTPNSPPLTTTSSTSPMITTPNSLLLTTASSLSPTTTSSLPPTTPNSPPPTVTNSDSTKLPSIEELRQRRGNRSLISKQSSLDD